MRKIQMRTSTARKTAESHEMANMMTMDIVMPGDFTDLDITKIEEDSDDDEHQTANVMDIDHMDLKVVEIDEDSEEESPDQMANSLLLGMSYSLS
jgi:hypothetical protein